MYCILFTTGLRVNSDPLISSFEISRDRTEYERQHLSELRKELEEHQGWQGESYHKIIEMTFLLSLKL